METIKKIYNSKQENSFNKILELRTELLNEYTTKKLCKLFLI
jgi:hypothetical protein